MDDSTTVVVGGDLMIRLPFPREIPVVEGAVLAAGVFAFGRWRSRHPQSTAGTVVWLGVITAAVLGGIDLWNWLPDWWHRAVLDPQYPVPLAAAKHLYLNSPGNLLFQGFLTPVYTVVLPTGRIVFSWYQSIWWWLPQAYISVSIAAVLCVTYLLGACQFRRLRYVGWGGATVAAGLGALRLGDLPWHVLHPAKWIFRDDLLQFIVLIAALPLLALITRRWAWTRPRRRAHAESAAFRD